LTAFVVCDADTAASDLRAYLRDRLPLALVPARIVPVDQIPLTTRGKVDVSALEAQARAAAHTAPRRSVPPETATERLLCRLWAAALQLPTCGVDDNFFDAGGDSIAAIRLAARATAEGLRVTPNDLFRHQTVRELARVIDRAGSSRGEAGAAPNDAVAPERSAPSAEMMSKIARLLAKAERTPLPGEDGS
jgi:aryl carrier-like protein